MPFFDIQVTLWKLFISSVLELNVTSVFLVMEAKHGSGRNNHPELPSFVIDEVQAYPEVITRDGINTNLERGMDSNWSVSSELFELDLQLLNPIASGRNMSVTS